MIYPGFPSFCFGIRGRSYPNFIPTFWLLRYWVGVNEFSLSYHGRDLFVPNNRALNYGSLAKVPRQQPSSGNQYWRPGCQNIGDLTAATEFRLHGGDPVKARACRPHASFRGVCPSSAVEVGWAIEVKVVVLAPFSPRCIQAFVSPPL